MQCQQYVLTTADEAVPANTQVAYTDVLGPLDIPGVTMHRCTQRSLLSCDCCRRSICADHAGMHGVCCVDEVMAA
jgi:hypothetical protein